MNKTKFPTRINAQAGSSKNAGEFDSSPDAATLAGNTQQLQDDAERQVQFMTRRARYLNKITINTDIPPAEVLQPVSDGQSGVDTALPNVRIVLPTAELNQRQRKDNHSRSQAPSPTIKRSTPPKQLRKIVQPEAAASAEHTPDPNMTVGRSRSTSPTNGLTDGLASYSNAPFTRPLSRMSIASLLRQESRGDMEKYRQCDENLGETQEDCDTAKGPRLVDEVPGISSRLARMEEILGEDSLASHKSPTTSPGPLLGPKFLDKGKQPIYILHGSSTARGS